MLVFAVKPNVDPAATVSVLADTVEASTLHRMLREETSTTGPLELELVQRRTFVQSAVVAPFEMSPGKT